MSVVRLAALAAAGIGVSIAFEATAPASLAASASTDMYYSDPLLSIERGSNEPSTSALDQSSGLTVARTDVPVAVSQAAATKTVATKTMTTKAKAAAKAEVRGLAYFPERSSDLAYFPAPSNLSYLPGGR